MKSRKSFLLRISPDLYRELEAWAQQELRSVNGQIEYVLHQAVRRRKGDAREDLSPRGQNKSKSEEMPEG
ncbi:MAG: Arc family DNA-binding protein [Rhodopirellula sp.]|nr:Arc family DNA-binding protein [Rhodopirellula sp.]